MTDQLLGEWASEPELLQEPTTAGSADPSEPTLYYGNLDDFAWEVIVQLYRRRVGERATHRWSAQWWRSAEATLRLDALWRSWEHLRLDPATGMSVWLRDHADHHMRMLLDPEGPFATSTDSNRPGEPLPYDPPAAGLFPDVR